MFKSIRETYYWWRALRRAKRNGFANYKVIKIPVNVHIQGLIANQELMRSTSLRDIEEVISSSSQDETENIISTLLQKGVSPDTLLDSAVFTNHFRLVPPLVEAGADVNHTTDEGLTPLMTACSRGNFESAKSLIEAGADVNIQDVASRSAVHYAALSGSSNIAKILAEAEADLDLCDENGIPAVHYASFVYEFETVDALTELGADPDLLIGTLDKNLVNSGLLFAKYPSGKTSS